MYLSSSSHAAVRFLASIKDGRGLKPSCHLAGITMTVGYRFLEEVYLRERRAGKLAKDVLLDLGVRSSLVQVWELRVGISNDRHHLRPTLRTRLLSGNFSIVAPRSRKRDPRQE
jgi:IS30 family transposase